MKKTYKERLKKILAFYKVGDKVDSRNISQVLGGGKHGMVGLITQLHTSWIYPNEAIIQLTEKSLRKVPDNDQDLRIILLKEEI